MMEDYYKQSMRALQLAGMSERTQQCYTRSIRMLVDFYNKTPDLISEQQLQDYFLHRKNKDKWSPATMRICYSGIKFFFINVLKRQWHTLDLIRAKSERRLPTVLSLDEIRSILRTVSTPQNKAYLNTVYSCGLRLHEALHLQVSDIHKDRMYTLRDVPRIFGFVLFHEIPSVLFDYFPSSHRGFARRRGCDVQSFRYRNRAQPEFSGPPIT